MGDNHEWLDFTGVDNLSDGVRSLSRIRESEVLEWVDPYQHHPDAAAKYRARVCDAIDIACNNAPVAVPPPPLNLVEVFDHREKLSRLNMPWLLPKAPSRVVRLRYGEEIEI